MGEVNFCFFIGVVDIEDDLGFESEFEVGFFRLVFSGDSVSIYIYKKI
jgi:hypothetical protein